MFYPTIDVFRLLNFSDSCQQRSTIVLFCLFLILSAKCQSFSPCATFSNHSTFNVCLFSCFVLLLVLFLTFTISVFLWVLMCVSILWAEWDEGYTHQCIYYSRVGGGL